MGQAKRARVDGVPKINVSPKRGISDATVFDVIDRHYDLFKKLAD